MGRVIVVGGGIVGAAAAWHLTRAGARVLLLERAAAPATGASRASFSRATAFGKGPRRYFDLNHAGLRELHDLRAAGVPGFHPCPSLVWDRAPDDLAARLAEARRWGYGAEPVPRSGPEIPAGVDRAALPPAVGLLPGEGWVDLPAMAAWLLDRARGAGAEVRFGTEVAGLAVGDGGAVHGAVTADGRTEEGDVLVNAAGAGGQEIAGFAGGPLALAPTRGLLVDVAAPGGLAGMLLAPAVSVRPAGPDRVRVRSDAVDARLRDAAPAAVPGGLVTELIERAATLLPALQGARPESVRVGVRAFPADGLSSVGTLGTAPGYYEIVTHSGATLGPLLGRLAAEEIADGHRSPLLAVYAPERFAAGARNDTGAAPAPAHPQ
ncbi:glycine/D-amino acid oxidase-like deaminating enzyme [Murinocardiopsis flavida]|uniref:Glycine/D-amino acid oxidase-like deaminating enzyme n=1 Tax=Murinocardiopsis flavida TaxID=645275 RepID=A0A2P8CWT9_9ACTN|nr:FAD-dependent oxidoreductase [Murinocardiopsis flavida]PSK89431.1 glycine/D-amino acid oxidase-like deaminating enzyme [Murinocardiopsis flavida]